MPINWGDCPMNALEEGNKNHQLIKDRLSNIKETNEMNFNTVSDELKNLLAEKNINCKIFGREKTLLLLLPSEILTSDLKLSFNDSQT